MDSNDKDAILTLLRDNLKYTREQLKEIDDEEIQAIGHVIDTLILVSYNPDHLLELTLILTAFLNSKIGGSN